MISIYIVSKSRKSFSQILSTEIFSFEITDI